MPANDLLILGLAPRVIALHRATGEVAWATELPVHATIVSIRVSGGRVYAGSAGEVVCLDAASGKILWHNPLKGFGVNPVLFANEDGAAASAAAQDAAGGAAAAAAAAGA